jgi:hypothetical protein
LLSATALRTERGVSLDEAFPAQLEKMLRADGFNVKVINAGVDGDTTDPDPITLPPA